MKRDFVPNYMFEPAAKAAAERSAQLSEDVEKFLKAGGKIQHCTSEDNANKYVAKMPSNCKSCGKHLGLANRSIRSNRCKSCAGIYHKQLRAV